MKPFLIAIGVLFLAGCGARSAVTRPFPVNDTTCPYQFKSVKYCALLEWDKGPSSKLAGGSDYTLKFFPMTANPKGPYSNPPAEVTTVPQMACCGTPAEPKSFTQTAPGVFAAKGVMLLKGNYKIVVTLLDAAKKPIEALELLVPVP